MFSGLRSLTDTLRQNKNKPPDNTAVVIEAIVNWGAGLVLNGIVPVNYAEGMQVAQCQSHLRCIERSPGLRKGALPLEVVEELST